jgi:ketosteroid isomerase-like protein
MRKMTFVTLVLLALPAFAAEEEKGKRYGGSEAAVAAVRLMLDKADEAFNHGDAKALIANFDKGFFFGGATLSTRQDVEAAKADVEKMFANGPTAKITRGDTTIHVDETGDSAWYIAEYVLVPKVGPGVLPVHRKMRESGVLVKHGKDWKFAMVHLSQVQPDPQKPAPPPAPAAPAPAPAK